MLAPPVQEATKHHALNPVFKKIYNFYSTADFMQIADMQGVCRESYKEAPAGTSIPLFSERTYPPAPHIKQVRMLLDGQSPGHLHFLLKRCLKRFPVFITQADTAGDYAQRKNFCLITIPEEESSRT